MGLAGGVLNTIDLIELRSNRTKKENESIGRICVLGIISFNFMRVEKQVIAEPNKMYKNPQRRRGNQPPASKLN